MSNAAGSNGLATTAGVGSTTVSATSGGVTGSTTLTVTDATLVSIEVSPAAPSIANGLTQQFTATGHLHATTRRRTSRRRSPGRSSDSAVATVSNAAGSNGLATTAGVGSTTVSATSGAVTGSTTLTVTDATLVSIEVTPATPSIANGSTQQFTATGIYTRQLDAGPHDAGHLGLVGRRGGDGEQRRRLERPGDHGRRRQHHRVGDQRRGDRQHDVDGDRRDAGVDRGDAGDPEHRERLDSAVHGDRHSTRDNSTQDLTTQVTWASSDSAVATVSNAAGSNGLATTAGVGSTTVSATSDAVTGEHDVDGDRRDPGVDRGDAGDAEHRERLDAAVHGDRTLHATTRRRTSRHRSPGPRPTARWRR